MQRDRAAVQSRGLECKSGARSVVSVPACLRASRRRLMSFLGDGPAGNIDSVRLQRICSGMPREAASVSNWTSPGEAVQEPRPNSGFPSFHNLVSCLHDFDHCSALLPLYCKPRDQHYSVLHLAVISPPSPSPARHLGRLATHRLRDLRYRGLYMAMILLARSH